MNRNQTVDLLTYVQAFDGRTVGDGDVGAWHTVLGGHDYALAHEAVTEWFSRPDVADRRLMPAHIAGIIADTRRREIEREHAEQITGGPTVPVDPQLGLPIAGADGKPVWTAYEQHNAIELVCRTCNAQPDEACVNKNTGMTRKIPCVARLADGHNRASRRSAQR